MDKEIAKSLMDIAISTDKLIGMMFSEIEKISDDNERKKFNDSVANLMGFIARDIIFPIEKKFPELNPDS